MLEIINIKILNRAVSQFGSISIKQYLILTIVSCLIFLIIILFRTRILRKQIELLNATAWICLIVYINIIIQLTLLGRKPGSRIGIDFSLGRSSNENDFSKLLRAYSMLNVLLFVPYGFILGMLSRIRKYKHYISIIIISLVSLASSILIECVQYITRRGYLELDDLICNTIGGIIGGILLNILCCIIMRVKR